MKIISSASSLATIWCISFLPILAHAQEVHDGLHHLSDHFATTGHLPTSPDEHLEYILTDKNLTVVWQSHQGQLSTRRRKADKKWNKNNDKKKKKKKKNKKKEKKEKIKQQINSGSREITKTLRPTDDAFITRSNRNKNYNLNQLRFSDSLPLTRSFIKFQIGNTAKNAKQVQSATLRLYALSELQSQVTIHTVGGNWDEKKVTWKNAPRTIGPKKTIQYLVPKKRAEGNKGKMWYNVDVTEAVKWNLEQGRKVVTFRLSATYSARRNKDSNKERIGLLAAKEYNNGAYSPRLVLKVNKSASSSSNNKPNNIKPNKPQASNPNPQPRPKPIPIAPKPKPKPPSGSNSSAIAKLTISTLASKEEEINNKLFLYLNAITGANEPSTIYKYIGLEKGLKVMSEKGVNGHYFYLGSGLNINQASKYGLVNVAAFLAQSMKETIKYNACDENNWDLVDGKYYAISNACGQLGQSYQDYHCPPDEKHMECPVDKNMEITAVTHATWYGAPGPLYCGPKKNPKDFTGFWDYMYECNNPWATPPETCDVYPNQKAGRYDNTVKIANVAGRTDVEGCCWWGRGVIQTTGVCNFGKLNYHLGKRAASEGREAAYPDVDFCKNPEVICSSPKYAELKWIAGLFYWMESVQSYNVRGWNYLKRLHAFVDGGYSDPSFIDSVSGIVNRGCHDPPCGTGDVDGLQERAGNFESALSVFGLL